MAVHYLTIPEIGEKFKKHIPKKELDIQSVGTTITINYDQVVIIDDPRYSKEDMFTELDDPNIEKWFE